MAAIKDCFHILTLFTFVISPSRCFWLGPCDMVLCIYGAVCIENELGRPQCVCNKECPEMVAPVCGSDGTTYLSECFLDRASCEEKRMILVDSQGGCGEYNASSQFVTLYFLIYLQI